MNKTLAAALLGAAVLLAPAPARASASSLRKVLTPAPGGAVPPTASEAEQAKKDHKLVSDLLSTMPAEAKHLAESRDAIMKGVEESRRRLAQLEGESAGALARHVRAAHEHLQLKRQRMMQSISDVHNRIDKLSASDNMDIENPFAENDSMAHDLEASIAAIKRRLAVLNSGPKSDDEIDLS